MLQASSDYVSRLRAENEELLAENQMLRNALTPDVPVPVDWRLWRSHRIIFRALLAQDIVSADALSLALGMNGEGRDVSAENVQCMMSHLRKRTKDRGVVITSQRHVGYSLQDRLGWRKRLMAAQAEKAPALERAA